MRKVMLAGMIGNGLEWYDFALYGYFAPILGKLFFPAHDPYVQMIATYGVFAAGFIMRPVGAVLFGYLGDKYGRRFSLMVSIVMMAIPTAVIGLLPGYAQIGILAPIALTVVRLFQGMSLAGQYSGSIAFVVEHAPMGRRGFAASTTALSLCGGMLLGSCVAMTFAKLLSPEALELWGWRIPFLLGVCIAFVGFYIRHRTEESPHYEKAKDEGKLSNAPVSEAITQHFFPLLRGIGIYMSVTVPFYINTVFINGFLTNILGHPLREALIITTVCMTLMMVIIPYAGALSDRIGRKTVLRGAALGYIVMAWPLFWLTTQHGLLCPLIAQMLFAVILAFYMGPASAVFVELFPTSVRYTGMSLSYNICAAIFGGTAPMVATWLIEVTHVNTIVAFYVMLSGCISWLAFTGYHDRYKEELH